MRWARGRRFDLALGHGSDDVTLAAALLRIPAATMFDPEWAAIQPTINCRLARVVVVPDAIPPERLRRYGALGKLRRFPGLKEEAYLADFRPDPERARRALGLDRARPIVDPLFARLCRASRRSCCRARPSSAPRNGFVVPERPIDAQSLVAFADIVVSAGAR